ncbi:hypothetical protein [Arthrobacter sp. VKM Ac-2550]|uniref:hypothetical protein n=1 Tax=Crystallibacter permensis TaxID=1938888 RepID=UPI0022266C93|nr:hypothetical protein [Arthrobacter sp. VKM Ac-2550]MCW2134167.1 hypothetical protein [Arthrobacter sp. VKM Ac-2550]
MNALIWAVTNPFPDQGTDLRPGLEPDQVTPGALGFFATFFLVVAVVLLMRSMASHIRKVRYRSMVLERLEPSPAAAGIPSAGTADGRSVSTENAALISVKPD